MSKFLLCDLTSLSLSLSLSLFSGSFWPKGRLFHSLVSSPLPLSSPSLPHTSAHREITGNASIREFISLVTGNRALQSPHLSFSGGHINIYFNELTVNEVFLFSLSLSLSLSLSPRTNYTCAWTKNK